ncbi:MAG: MarC family NAAT transporter [Burkholderiales bacterium]|jgi:multiple antibiotic resistance protein|nr:MarC family NAAT transporter [Burkholderiales bacterium]
MRVVIENFLLVVLALLPIANPLSSMAIFIAITDGLTQKDRILLARRVAVNAFLLLAASLFIGNFVLLFFGLSVPIVQVAGGLIVCHLGWGLLHQETSDSNEETASGEARRELHADKNKMAKAFYPLTLPLTVGPGTISVAITLGANHASSVQSLFTAAPSFVVGAAVVAASIYLCFRYAYQIMKLLGTTGTQVVFRLFAFILLCIGVQIIWNGVSSLLGQLSN